MMPTAKHTPEPSQSRCVDNPEYADDVDEWGPKYPWVVVLIDSRGGAPPVFGTLDEPAWTTDPRRAHRLSSYEAARGFGLSAQPYPWDYLIVPYRVEELERLAGQRKPALPEGGT